MLAGHVNPELNARITNADDHYIHNYTKQGALPCRGLKMMHMATHGHEKNMLQVQRKPTITALTQLIITSSYIDTYVRLLAAHNL